jgi:hypothetical protein
MLKALVQLFAESFLKSKKKWLSERSVKLAYPETVFEIPKTNTWTSFTMPFDGWAVVKGPDHITVAIDCCVFEGEHQMQRVCVRGFSDNFAAVSLPCEKGKTLRVAVYSGSQDVPAGTLKAFPFS